MEANSTRADEMIIRADLGLLYSILEEFVQIAQLFEDSKEMLHLLKKLDRFVAIHETRCNDLLFFKGKIDDARAEYSKLKAKNDFHKEQFEHFKKLYNELLDSKL